MLGLICLWLFVIMVVWCLVDIFHKVSKLEQKVDNIYREELYKSGK